MELEPREQILHLKQKIQGLNEIIQEAKSCQEFKESNFFKILDRTLNALDRNYRVESFKAAKSSLAEVGNFLGRMEMIDDFYDILEKFSINADQAQLEIDAAEELIKQLNEQITDDAKQEQSLDSGGSMG
jgi:5-bromo-4-chloroindolyl phosphate hydrolysis protein